MIAGPGDTYLQHRIMNLAGTLACCIMKTQSHAWPNLQLEIFQMSFQGILRCFEHFEKKLEIKNLFKYGIEFLCLPKLP
jgi:hypothetical protein